MRNIVKFDVTGRCKCACVANIACSEHSIVLIYEANEFIAPKVLLDIGKTLDLTVKNGVATCELPYDELDGCTNFQTRFIDGDKIGKWFSWEKPETIETNFETFVNVAYEDNMFKITIKRRTATVTEYSNDFTVTDDGKLQLKKATEINVTKNADDVITNVTIKYDDESQSSNNCAYDSGGNLIKFGDLNINWG